MADRIDFETLKKSAVKPKAEPTPDRPQVTMGAMPTLKSYDEARADNRSRPSLVKGLIQQGSIYGLTGMTGHAKTTMSLYMAYHISQGGFIGSHKHEVMATGTVVFLAGENPANVLDQWEACCLAQGSQPADVRVIFMDQKFDVHKQMDAVINMLSEIEDLRLVVVDTLQAFFMGEDDNSNMAMVAFAQAWRPVTLLPSLPTVLINCHPAGKTLKDVKERGLSPRGGGAFLGEIDANLSILKDDDGLVTLHWFGKFRGAEPDPVQFELQHREFAEIKDADGEPVTMTTLQITSEVSRSKKWGREVEQMKRVLYRIDLKQSTAERALAEHLGISKNKVRDLIDAMIGRKIVKRNAVGGGLSMTPAGKKEFQRIQEEDEAANPL